MGIFSKRSIDRGRILPTVSQGEIVVWTVFSFLAAYGAPFGTYGVSFGRRLIYWSLVVVISSLFASFFNRLARAWTRRAWVEDGIVVALMTVFFTPVLFGLSMGILSPSRSPVPFLLHLGQFVAVISLGVVLTRRVIPPLLLRGDAGPSRFGAPAPAEGPQVQPAAVDLAVPDPVEERLRDPVGPAEADPPEEMAPPPPRLMRRLPETFAGPILRLSSEDHFVDVVGAEGHHRLRMRLTDAIDEMDTVDGYCSHRSHWVARVAIEGVEREGGRIFLRLVNGDRVPVSRTYKPDLEAAGIL
ncbi:LytTR family DNA-binding domain-containing protein [Pseudodonghicola flavimaris]|uniref:LytTR family DNA-binding domain-containing protein n=1 Tax=Pseudodonghicola flavimaris TaxID=3050036 RepID=A0ABT7EXR8_9RHOB|nr:LytTR family DNA-binding domain-containing protein [Pseudodonghicola flavimaris]MDK3017139.1 LytTR family DNA-binding domain-containing protein [Pseudodonghicola flavimaris]